MNVYLVRHTSVDVPKGLCYGQSDVALKDTFLQEAQAVKEKLSGLKEIKFDRVFCSPLSRCVKLAEYCGYGNAVRDERILEINFGKWEMQMFEDIKDPRILQWYNDYLHVRATDGESFNDQFIRVNDFLQELKYKGYKNVLLFTHGGVLICSKIASGLITPQEAFKSLDQYGSVIKIVID